ncbi:MAG: XRE family transcriptional regulator [Pseudomonadota bacterium]
MKGDHGSTTLGRDIRALRKARGVTLQALAGSVGRSVGWMSQVERDISEPTLVDLQRIAGALRVPLSLFFGATPAPVEEAGRIVREASRRTIGEREGGLVESLLSPDLTDPFEVVHSLFLPGSARVDPVRRETSEVAYMVAGTLDVTLSGTVFTVTAGDSFRVRGEPFSWANPYAEPAVAVWVIAPPIY